MRAVYWTSTADFEHALVAAVTEGAARHGDAVEQRYLADWREGVDTGDLMVLTGMHVARLAPSNDSRERGRRVLHLDKGITRTGARSGRGMKSEYWRMSLDTHQPVRLLTKLGDLPSDRRKAQRWRFPGWRGDRAGPVLLCPPGRRECLWYGLGSHVEFSQSMADLVAKEIDRQGTGSDIVFRPKPRHVMQHQWEDPPRGTAWDRWERPIDDSLLGANRMVAYSTSATLNALLAGIPITTLGPNWASRLAVPISTDYPFEGLLPDSKTIHAELNRLAYLQWTWDEWRDGSAWEFVRLALEKSS